MFCSIVIIVSISAVVLKLHRYRKRNRSHLDFVEYRDGSYLSFDGSFEFHIFCNEKVHVSRKLINVATLFQRLNILN